MGIVGGIVLYIIIYWTVLFCVLPFGNAAPEDVETGHSTGAPANPRIKQKFMITGVVAAGFWLVVFLLIHFDVIDFYDLAKQMENGKP